MSEKFVFQGQTTFVNQPRSTVIQNFQNTYITGDGSDKDEINSQISRLVELVLESEALPNQEKEETTQALHSVAEQVKEEKVNRLTLKGTFDAVEKVISKAADIFSPAKSIIDSVLKLLGIAAE